MKYPTNDLYLTKNERHGLYFMLGCMLILILTIFLVNNYTIQEKYEFEEVELLAFGEFVNETYTKSSKEGSNKPNQVEKEGFIFNPNTTPLDSLLMLPIPTYVAERIDKYRSKGGKFKTAEDLAKIYGIEKHFSKISKFVKIPQEHMSKESSAESITESNSQIEEVEPKDQPSEIIGQDSSTMKSNFHSVKSKKDSLDEYVAKEKTNADETLIMEINTANEYQLQMINGIGPYFSKKIVEFRNEIGGFYALDQLRDIGMRDENFNKVIPHLTCNAALIRKRNINYTRQDSLGMIPGIGYKKAKIAILYINNHFPLEGPEDLKKIKIFKDQEIELMLKYLKFKNE